MKYEELRKLLEKYRRQECNKIEIQQLNDWLFEQSNEKQIKNALTEELYNYKADVKNLEKVDFDEIFKNINAKINVLEQNELVKSKFTNKRKERNLILLRNVAVFLLLFLGGVLFHTIYSSNLKALM